MLVLGYFSQMILENAQGLINRNRVYKMISQNSHCTRSKKGEEMSRHKISNLRLLNF